MHVKRPQILHRGTLHYRRWLNVWSVHIRRGNTKLTWISARFTSSGLCCRITQTPERDAASPPTRSHAHISWLTPSPGMSSCSPSLSLTSRGQEKDADSNALWFLGSSRCKWLAKFSHGSISIKKGNSWSIQASGSITMTHPGKIILCNQQKNEEVYLKVSVERTPRSRVKQNK